jgi:hypothetical protein
MVPLEADRELEARRREVQELHVLLQQAQAALPLGGYSAPLVALLATSLTTLFA